MRAGAVFCCPVAATRVIEAFMTHDAFPGARAAPLNTVSGIVRVRGRHRTATISGGTDTAGPAEDGPSQNAHDHRFRGRTGCPGTGLWPDLPPLDWTVLAFRLCSGLLSGCPSGRRRPAAARTWWRSRVTMARTLVVGVVLLLFLLL